LIFGFAEEKFCAAFCLQAEKAASKMKKEQPVMSLCMFLV
jgi:hypothetical protein